MSDQPGREGTNPGPSPSTAPPSSGRDQLSLHGRVPPQTLPENVSTTAPIRRNEARKRGSPVGNVSSEGPDRLVIAAADLEPRPEEGATEV